MLKLCFSSLQSSITAELPECESAHTGDKRKKAFLNGSWFPKKKIDLVMQTAETKISTNTIKSKAGSTLHRSLKWRASQTSFCREGAHTGRRGGKRV